MNATQVFYRFLKECCTISEMRFFIDCINKPRNKYFKKRKLYNKNFVDNYLSNNHRTISSFITRLFILAPSLIYDKHKNPNLKLIVDDYNKTHRSTCKTYNNGYYVNYYKRKWRKFLLECIDDSNKKINSPFKKRETYNFAIKKKCQL